MLNRCHLLLIILILAAISHVMGSNMGEDTTEFYNDNYLRYKDYVYKDNIHTVLLYKEGWELSYPVIDLANPSKLILSFDDLDTDIKNYSYTFIHCDAGWQPSGLSVSDYIDGFNENRITEYGSSVNTTYKYTHYSIAFPNDDVKFKISGNYIVKVYDNFDQDNLVLTKRFLLVDHKISIDATVKRAVLSDLRKTSHEIDFNIEKKFYTITDPYSELKVILLQNFRWDNAITGLKPLFVKDDQLVYDFDEDNVFSANGEFRYFDIKSLRYQSEKIEQIVFKSNFYHVKLFNDERRSYKTYMYHQDFNGRYYVKVTEGQNSETDADYAYVYFAIPFDAPVVKGNIYVFGALTDWDFSKKNRLNYNFESRQYELSLLLKQGYYNYAYAYVQDGILKGDLTLTEGSHSEAENDYVILVYQREFSSRYDKLIGYQVVNSVLRSNK